MREATVQDLKVGDRFDFEGGSWHGPSVVLDVSESRPASKLKIRGRDCGRPALLRLEYENARIVNPPGLNYYYADVKVVLDA